MRLIAVGERSIENPDVAVLSRQYAIVWHNVIMAFDQPAALFIDVLYLTDGQSVSVCRSAARLSHPRGYGRAIRRLLMTHSCAGGEAAQNNGCAQKLHYLASQLALPETQSNPDLKTIDNIGAAARPIVARPYTKRRQASPAPH